MILVPIYVRIEPQDEKKLSFTRIEYILLLQMMIY